MWGGSLTFKTPMLFSLGFISMFMLGGLSGIMHASVPVDTQQQDSYFVVAHFHYVLFGGSILGLMAGFYYWFPKMSGRMLSEKAGQLNFWLTFIGFNVTFFPMHIAALQGMPRRIYDYPADQGWDMMNLLSSLGSVLIAVSVLVLIYNIFKSMRSGPPAGDNPWGGGTLEWSMSSPPPHYNFATIPVVTSQLPLWEEHEGSSLGAAHASEHQPHHDDEEAHVPMPSPSYWPIVLSALHHPSSLAHCWSGRLIPFAGLILVSFFGLVGLYSIYRWSLEPAFAESDQGQPLAGRTALAPPKPRRSY